MTNYSLIVLVCWLGILAEAIRIVRPGKVMLIPRWLGRYQHPRTPFTSEADRTSLTVLPVFPSGPTFYLKFKAPEEGTTAAQHLALDPVRQETKRIFDAVRPVQPFCQMMFILLAVFIPVSFWTALIIRPWQFVGGSILIVLAGLLTAYGFAHRRIFPGQKGKMIEDMVTMTLFPPDAVFAAQKLARDALQNTHPLAATLVLCPQDEAREVAGLYLRRWRHVIEGNDKTRAAEYYAAACDIIREKGWDPDEFLTAPEPDSSSSQSYCPRCHAQYMVVGGDCLDCPGVAKVAF